MPNLPLNSVFQTLSSHPADATLVTANQRAARVLQLDYARWQQGQGRTVWSRPRIQYWGNWLQALWHAVTPAERPMLLGPNQERAIWQQIITDSDWGGGLMQVGAVARSAQEAWDLMTQWRIPVSRLREFYLEDASALREWGGEFDRQCQQNGWLPNARLADALASQCAGNRELGRHILLHGFDEFTPQQHGLLEALGGIGCTVEAVEPGERPGTFVRTAQSGPEQELTAAARWARAQLEQDATLRIGIVVPDLRKHRALAERCFEDALHPVRVLPGGSQDNRAFNLSMGRPLAEWPVVEAALDIISMNHGQMELGAVSRLLSSPFLCGADSEMAVRAQFDAALYRAGESRFPLSYLIRQVEALAGEGGESPCPLLHQSLQGWRREGNALAPRQSPGGWAEGFGKLLTALGWPGERGLDSIEYQSVEAWGDLMSEFCSLDAVCRPMKAREAVAMIRSLALEKIYQPQTSDAPVQVLGLLEAAGLRFDRLWVCGMHDEQWPPAARPNALLPAGLQREFNLPMATADRALVQAQAVMARLLCSAPQGVFSYPIAEAERELRPSPLIRSLPGTPAEQLLTGETVDVVSVIHSAADLETVADEACVPVPRNGAVSGGTAVLRNQAACPFRAFAEHRLGTAFPEEPESGLDALDRGTLLHVTLEHVWKHLHSHQELLKTDNTRREQLVLEAAQLAIERMGRHRPYTLTERFVEVERDRLAAMALAWLQLEQKREPFTVLRPEAERQFSLGGLTLTLRIDRIDQLESGELVIIDYKTGRPEVRSWFGERPDDPQLPIYALCETESGNRLAAIVFGQVRVGDMGYKGIARSADCLPGVGVLEKHPQTKHVENWEAMLDDWRTQLSALAGTYCSGDAAVDPKDDNACRYCKLPMLCRVNELDHRLGYLTVREETDD